MILGKDTASIHNHIRSQSKQGPVVGKGMTRLMWTDREPYEVVHVSGDGKTIFVQEYNYRYTDSIYDGYAELLDLKPERIKLRKRYGNWWVCDREGKPMYKWNVSFGNASKYRDPHF